MHSNSLRTSLTGTLTGLGLAAALFASPVAAQDWSGGYVGGQIGYADIDGGLTGHDWIGGLHVGNQWDLGTVVIGGELDHDFADVDLGGADQLDTITRLKLRVGSDLGPAMIYGTLGSAYANATVGGASLSETGWFAGAGVAYQMNERWMLSGEVLSHKFDDFGGSGLDVDATTATVRASLRF